MVPLSASHTWQRFCIMWLKCPQPTSGQALWHFTPHPLQPGSSHVGFAGPAVHGPWALGGECKANAASGERRAESGVNERVSASTGMVALEPTHGPKRHGTMHQRPAEHSRGSPGNRNTGCLAQDARKRPWDGTLEGTTGRHSRRIQNT